MAAQIDIRVARSLRDLTEVIAVRSIVYVDEQRCPLWEGWSQEASATRDLNSAISLSITSAGVFQPSV
jgi:hypothetical protein